MRPVGITLTLLILVVPSLVLSIVFLVLVFMFQVSLDAPAVLDMVSTAVSMILVSLLVWERLRDSLFRKLGYLHDIALQATSAVQSCVSQHFGNPRGTSKA